jgi:hypothetical protein
MLEAEGREAEIASAGSAALPHGEAGEQRSMNHSTQPLAARALRAVPMQTTVDRCREPTPQACSKLFVIPHSPFQPPR